MLTRKLARSSLAATASPALGGEEWRGRWVASHSGVQLLHGGAPPYHAPMATGLLVALVYVSNITREKCSYCEPEFIPPAPKLQAHILLMAPSLDPAFHLNWKRQPKNWVIPGIPGNVWDPFQRSSHQQSKYPPYICCVSSCTETNLIGLLQGHLSKDKLKKYYGTLLSNFFR